MTEANRDIPPLSDDWPAQASSLQKIISGGQTGVDRATLDAALEHQFPAGGWCPEGRKAADGPIPNHYPVEELPGAGYRQRNRRNVTCRITFSC